MELSVLVQQVEPGKFRAWCGTPVAAEAEGATRDEALTKLTAELEARTSNAEVVRVVIGRPIPAAPIWPDDELTRDWLEGIAAAQPPPIKSPTRGRCRDPLSLAHR